jgi:hypothetical protein
MTFSTRRSISLCSGKNDFPNAACERQLKSKKATKDSGRADPSPRRSAGFLLRTFEGNQSNRRLIFFKVVMTMFC